MPPPLRKIIRSGYLLASVLLLISYFLIFNSTDRLRNETGWMAHSYSIINKLQQFKGAVADAETGERGYLITGDTSFLKPYNEGKKNAFIIFDELKNSLDDKEQTKELEILGSLLTARLERLQYGITNFDANGKTITQEMLAGKGKGKAFMDSLRQHIKIMSDREEIKMQDKKSKLSGFFSTAGILTMGSLITAILAIIYSLITFNRENRGKREADGKAEMYSRELENKVNELEKINAELKELKSIEKFAATGRIARTMAHEVRNPLTNISLAAEQLQEMASNNDSSVLLDMISRNAVRINQIVADLLNATKFVQLDAQENNINKLLDETLEMAKDRIELNQIKVEKNYAEDICGIAVDAEKMKVAFLNIIVNAIEAMETGQGILQLRTRATNTQCIIEIRDNGSGMDEETLQKIFEPYFTGKPKGNGLGLTNTQNIILNHNGSLKVQSKVGQGTAFFILLNKT